MNPMVRRSFLAGVTSLVAGRAMAQQAKVEVSHPWARATAASARSGAAYLSLMASAADAVVSASSPVAGTVELHRTVQEGGVMKMLPVEVLALEPGKMVELKPGGLHIMLVGLKMPLKRGETFPLTLTFRNAPPQTVQVSIEAAGAAGPSHAHGH